jgi:hypothetical protein
MLPTEAPDAVVATVRGLVVDRPGTPGFHRRWPSSSCVLLPRSTAGGEHGAEGSQGHRDRRRARDGRVLRDPARTRRARRSPWATSPRRGFAELPEGIAPPPPRRHEVEPTARVRRLGSRADGRPQRPRQQRRDHPRRPAGQEGPRHRRDRHDVRRAVAERSSTSTSPARPSWPAKSWRRWPTTGTRPGVIINMSSVARHGNRGQTNYVATKAAVAANAVTWAREFARFGIRVAAIAPGMIETPMTVGMNQKARDALVARCPAAASASPTTSGRRSVHLRVRLLQRPLSSTSTAGS